jgi:IclR family pca regulon transcriptional regulator
MTTTPAPPSPSDQFVQSLARGLAVIEAFGADAPAPTLSEVAAAVGLPRAAVRRFLLTLVHLGYARQTNGRFTLTPRVLRLGAAYLGGLGLPELAEPHLERLSQEVHESTSIAVLDGGDIVYVARVIAHRYLRLNLAVGTRFPAFATSMGRVLLAGLSPEELDSYFATADLTPPTRRTTHSEGELRALIENVRWQGWAFADEQFAYGVRSLAAGVRDATGNVVAAIDVSSTTVHDPVGEYLDALLETATAISADLGTAGLTLR